MLVRDPSGASEPQAFLCTNLAATPERIFGWFISRWRMETTFQEVRTGLLDQIDGPVGSMIADGAYDGQVVYDAVTHRHPEAKVIIPPRSTAVPSKAPTSQRDQHVQAIAERGRISWQRSLGYGRRSLAETAMYRYKTIIGRRLRARTLPNQRAEAKIGCNVLNRMTNLGMPVSVPIK